MELIRETIEELLRGVPTPDPPAGLFERLRRDIMVPCPKRKLFMQWVVTHRFAAGLTVFLLVAALGTSVCFLWSWAPSHVPRRHLSDVSPDRVSVSAKLEKFSHPTPYVRWPIILSVNPLFSSKEEIVFDPSLLGVWQSGTISFNFEQIDGRSYLFTIVTPRFAPIIVDPSDRGEPEVVKNIYKAYLVKIGEHLFLDLFPYALPEEHQRLHRTQAGHFAHSFMLVEKGESRLRISPINRKELFSSSPGLELVEQNGRLLLVCSTATLRTLLEKWAEDLGSCPYTGTFECLREVNQDKE